jgi:hypothetical protein
MDQHPVSLFLHPTPCNILVMPPQVFDPESLQALVELEAHQVCRSA